MLCQSLIVSCLLLLSEDVEVNPGPGPRHHVAPAPNQCSNQNGIFCGLCYSWYHTSFTGNANKPGLAQVMKVDVARSVIKKLFLSIIPLFFHVQRKLLMSL